jgi:hypothetical protein
MYKVSLEMEWLTSESLPFLPIKSKKVIGPNGVSASKNLKSPEFVILLFCVSFLIKRLVEILLSILNLHFCGMLVVFK